MACRAEIAEAEIARLKLDLAHEEALHDRSVDIAYGIVNEKEDLIERLEKEINAWKERAMAAELLMDVCCVCPEDTIAYYWDADENEGYCDKHATPNNIARFHLEEMNHAARHRAAVKATEELG